MAKIEKSIEIKASPEKVWPMVLWDRIPEWYDDFKKVQYTSKEKHKVGSTVHVIAETAGMKAEWDAEITEAIENEKGAWRTTGGSFTGFGSVTLSPTKAGTKVTIAMDYELPYSVLGKLIDKLRVHKALEKGNERGLEKLKGMLEK
ncbi:MAG: SRPBCC family protein [Candidatus Bathyarchaeia archaeon]